MLSPFMRKWYAYQIQFSSFCKVSPFSWKIKSNSVSRGRLANSSDWSFRLWHLWVAYFFAYYCLISTRLLRRLSDATRQNLLAAGLDLAFFLLLMVNFLLMTLTILKRDDIIVFVNRMLDLDDRLQGIELSVTCTIY